MKNIYTETISLCPVCGMDSMAHYHESAGGMILVVECEKHGVTREPVASNVGFFKKWYETDYLCGDNHLVLPVTYRCNINCKYCYSLSNTDLILPKDRSQKQLIQTVRQYPGNITLIGGEPTVRDDLILFIENIKRSNPKKRISIATNGQRLMDMEYVKKIKEAGTDFVFLSLNDMQYEVSSGVYNNKIKALENCSKLRIPVWLQRTVDDLPQLDSILELIDIYKKNIFNVTIRSVKPFGKYLPSKQIFVWEMLNYLKKENDALKGVNPFNNFVHIKGIKIKFCSWVNDMKRLDPIDSNYLISDDTMTTFHRGMKLDEVYLMKKGKENGSIS